MGGGGNTQSISRAETSEVKKDKKSAKKLKDSKVSLESSASKSSLRASVGWRGNLLNTSDTGSKIKGDNLQSSGQWVENFTPEFRAFIDSKYQWEQSDYEANREFFINSKIFDEKCGLQEKSQGSYLNGNDRRDFSPLPHLSQKAEFILTPEAILGYIYAVLFHKEYREKYLDFLKIDFPKIPFVESKELFLEFSTLGQELIRTHLMADNERERGTRRRENESQYRISNLQANERLTGLSSRFCGAYDNGDVLHFKQRDRGQLCIPPLSLPKGASMNLGLVCDRGAKMQEINNIFIADSIIDLHLVGAGSYVFPLYIKE